MRNFWFCLFFSLSSWCADYVDNLPNGHFAGPGSWSDNLLDHGQYQTYVEIKNNIIRADYSFGGNSMTNHLEFLFYGPGMFDVKSQDEIVGNGHCDIGQCHYTINSADAHFGESLYFFVRPDGRPYLVKVGHKQIGDRVIDWHDVLDHLTIDAPSLPDPLIP